MASCEYTLLRTRVSQAYRTVSRTFSTLFILEKYIEDLSLRTHGYKTIYVQLTTDRTSCPLALMLSTVFLLNKPNWYRPEDSSECIYKKR